VTVFMLSRVSRRVIPSALGLVLVVAGVGSTSAATESARAAQQQQQQAEGPPPPSQRFKSRPDLKPPPVKVLTAAHGTAPGLVFLGPKMKVVQAGPMIVDNRGQVVWFHPLDTFGVSDVKVQHYHGKPVITWWRGRAPMGPASPRPWHWG